MTEAERERRTQAWHELIERLAADEGYRQDPRTASGGWRVGPNRVVTYVTRRTRVE